jgi:hypothetical protein
VRGLVDEEYLINEEQYAFTVDGAILLNGLAASRKMV